MEEEVRLALSQAFTDGQIALETTDLGNIAGYVVSAAFEGHSQMDRQEWLWRELRNRVSPETQHHITVILTMTPAEIEDDVQASDLV